MTIQTETIGTDEAERRGILEWPRSERSVARFSWHYDATEVAYIEQGSARIETEDGNIEIESGDLVTLPAGLDCTWVIRETLIKRYKIYTDLA
ncbi:MAG: cupin domain-containing protein [Spirochaetales bacterium]